MSPKDFTPTSQNPSKRTGWHLPELWGEPIQCISCTGSQFRRSRLTSEDIGHLLRLTYPVRCIRCGLRQYASLVVAAQARDSSTRQPRPMRRNKPTSWAEPADRMVLHKQDEGSAEHELHEEPNP